MIGKGLVIPCTSAFFESKPICGRKTVACTEKQGRESSKRRRPLIFASANLDRAVFVQIPHVQQHAEIGSCN